MTKQWEDVREAVLYLYKQQNQPLHVVKATMEQKYRFKASIRAYRSRLKKWGVNKYKSRRKTSMAITNKTIRSEEAMFPSCSSPQTPDARLTLDSSLAMHPDYFGHGMFSTDSSTDEENSPVTFKPEPGSPSPTPFYEHPTPLLVRTQGVAPRLNSLIVATYRPAHRQLHGGFVSQSQRDPPVHHWPGLHRFSTHGP